MMEMMDKEPTMSNDHRLPRRELIRIAGIGGLTVAAAGVAGGIPLSALAASAQDETPEGFLAYAYAQRAQAMTTGNTSLLDALYDPANTSLLGFEKSRVTFFHLGLAARWDGSILGYLSAISLLDLTIAGTEATARVYEALSVNWIPRPQPVPPGFEQLRQREPAKYQSLVPHGPRGEITSKVGIRHEVTLVKGNSGWRIAKDAYDGRHVLYGASPDLLPGSWAEVRWGGPATGAAVKPARSASPAAGQAQPLNQCSYNYTAAATYAGNHCTSYNGNYCNYNPCGGDCTNFVSQCFSTGGENQDGTWYAHNGACGFGCSGSSANAGGSAAWVNNEDLRNWVINAGRGSAQGSIYNLGVGDIINYDWNNDGIFDHVTIVTQAGGNALICSHNTDACNVPWQFGNNGSYQYTTLYSLYNC
jgi:hypothetical protein